MLRRLRTAVGHERVVRRANEIGIVEINVGETVSRRRQVDHTGTRAKQRSDAVDEHKMSQVIGAELRLKTIGGVAERSGHHAGVGDDPVEDSPLLRSLSAHSRTLARLPRSRAISSRLPPLAAASLRTCRLLFGLAEVPRRPYYVCAVRGQSARRLDSEAGRNAGDQYSLAIKPHAFQNIFCGCRSPEYFYHFFSFYRLLKLRCIILASYVVTSD